MLDLQIVRLYNNVLDRDIRRCNIPTEAIKVGIESMAHVYKPETGTLRSERSTVADYTDIAHRCAYLHKYAAFHTAMVRDMLISAIKVHYDYFQKLVFSDNCFKLCSLGGGPGSDIIGVLSALQGAFAYFNTSAIIIDYMIDWSLSFDAILAELGSGAYGPFGSNTCQFLNWRYVGANLLKRSFAPEVNDALSDASFITMIKFVSATTCQDTPYMIKNIFAAMKPGAAVLFIDNDGGGFHQLMLNAANEFNFISIFGPLRRETYTNDLLRMRRFGYTSCCRTTVTVHILQKPFPMPQYNYYLSPYVDNQNEILFDSYRPRRSILLPSPLTPMLYHPPPRDLAPITPMLHHPQPRDLAPLTPMVNHTSSHELAPLNHVLPYSFAEDENITNNFSSPPEEIPQRSQNIMLSRVVTPLTNNVVNSPLLSTPGTQRRQRMKSNRNGCFPFKLKTFRHHLSRKVNQVKSRAREIFKSKKASHPIFRI